MDESVVGADTLPEGDYCLLELFGHQTLVGKFVEVERFGAKMLAIECLFNGTMLPPVFHGGAAIYRLTPCTVAVAWARQPKQVYQLPPTIAATLPAAALPPGQLPLDLGGIEIGGADEEAMTREREREREEDWDDRDEY
jgi:hypothetical protein